jgi:predicted transcriptional regulator of viral defense system
VISSDAIEEKAKTRPDLDGLFAIAESQAGYFTAQQARESGFSGNLVLHHVKGGRFGRVRHGLYRFRHYPSSRREDAMAAWLALGKTAVVSHDTALELHDLSDVIPSQVHLTVPRSRRNLPKLPGVWIHTTLHEVEAADVVQREGMSTTSVVRTIVDLIGAKWFPPDQLEEAGFRALEAGLLNSAELQRAAAQRGTHEETWVRAASGLWLSRRERRGQSEQDG